MKYLVTGAAGFIGSFVSRKLLSQGHEVLGVDNLNPYYDPQLKKDRLIKLLGNLPGFRFVELELANREAIQKLYAEFKPDRVIHLAAQAGVRYSLSNPYVYIDSNIMAFVNLLEAVRHVGAEHFVYASSSSVYGANGRMPFSEHLSTEHPVSLYAATKKANEMIGHAYSDLYKIPATGLRFFTVYGPWGRPDMAAFLFTRKILAGEPIEVFHHGEHRRDFTFIDDIVEGVVRVSGVVPKPSEKWNAKSPDPAISRAPHRIFNIGNSSPVYLKDFISSLEKALGREAQKIYVDMQAGDVAETFADCSDLEAATGFRPGTSVDEGLRRFVAWYQDYYCSGPKGAKN